MRPSELRLYGVLGSSGLPSCSVVLSAMEHIHSPKTGVCCLRYAANRPPREGAGQRPALLLDQGQLPGRLTRRKAGTHRPPNKRWGKHPSNRKDSPLSDTPAPIREYGTHVTDKGTP